MSKSITFTRMPRSLSLEIKLHGERVGSIMQSEDRAGIYWAWSAFYDGRFGGSAQTNQRHTAMDEAKAAAAEWLHEQLREKDLRMSSRPDARRGDGLRDETGALIGGLVVFDYVAGHADYEAGRPPPRVTSASYDLGRQRAAEDAAARAAALAQIEARREKEIAAVRSMLPAEAAAELDRRLADIASGVDAARCCWESLSDAQRRLVHLLAQGPRVLVRSRSRASQFDIIGEPHAVSAAGRVATVRALVAHGVLSWAGTEDDREARAVLTRKGNQVGAVATAAGDVGGDAP